MTPFTVTQGDSPVILGMPHIGTWLPDDLTARLNDNGRKLADTDCISPAFMMAFCLARRRSPQPSTAM